MHFVFTIVRNQFSLPILLIGSTLPGREAPLPERRFVLSLAGRMRFAPTLRNQSSPQATNPATGIGKSFITASQIVWAKCCGCARKDSRNA